MYLLPNLVDLLYSTDVKAASGLMNQPVFPLAGDLQPVSASIQERIAPPDTSELQRVGVAFISNPHLSPCLLSILRAMRDIVLYGQACNQNPAVLCTDDHEFFRSLNREVEHRLLSYVYSDSTTRGMPFSETTSYLGSVEAVTRIASICYLNHFLIVSPPSSGLGRALTRHLKQAIANCHWPPLSKEGHGLFAWVLFIGAQSQQARLNAHGLLSAYPTSP